MEIRELNLNSLGDGSMPGVTKSIGASYAEAAAVCLDDFHKSGVKIKINGSFDEDFKLVWPEVTDQMRRCHNDHEVATENGAYGIAFLLSRSLTLYTVLERAVKGGGFDWWLGTNEDSFFQNKMRLEVSGIRNGADSEIKNRVKQKLKQTEKSDGTLDALIIITEYSAPLSHVVKKCRKN